MDYTYLTSLKTEFHDQLVPILTLHIYCKLKEFHDYSEKIYSKVVNNNKAISIKKIFSEMLHRLEDLNNHQIEKQYMIIKSKSDCYDFFDNLVVASFKSFILFITWDPEKQTSHYTDNDFFKTISIKDFIHKCHVVTAKYFDQNYELFLNRNKKDINDIIATCINIAMIKMLPYNEMLNKYIENNFTSENFNNRKDLNKLKSMVNNFIENGKYGSIPNNVYIENDEPKTDYSENDNNVDNFIRQQELEKFNNKLNGIQNKDILEDEDDDDNNDKNYKNDNEINGEINDEIDNDVQSENINTFSSKDEEKEKQIDDIIDNVSQQTNSTEEEEIKILKSPPALKTSKKSNLEELGVKNKIKLTSTKKSSNNKIKEMNDFFDNMLS